MKAAKYLWFVFSLFTLPVMADIAQKKQEKEKNTYPIEVVVFSSLTCPHCAIFHQENYKHIQKYLEQGHIKYEFRDVLADNLSFLVTVLSWCLGKERRSQVIHTIFTHYDDWISARDPLDTLKQILEKEYNVQRAHMDTCLKDEKLSDEIIKIMMESLEKDKIEGTPTIIINGQVRDDALEGNNFERIVEALIEQAPKEKR